MVSTEEERNSETSDDDATSNTNPDLRANTDEDCDEDARVKEHKSYEQVMLDVSRCAGRLVLIKQVYFHRKDDDEPPEDLTEELERLANDEVLSHDDSQLLVIGDQESAAHNTMSSDADENDRHTYCEQESIGSRDRRVSEDLLNQRKLKKKLAKLIVKLLIEKPNLHYYQGFHDVCLTYMTISGEQEAFKKLDSLVDTHFKTFMQPTMNETQDFLAMIPIIIGLHDSRVQDFLEKAEVGTIFALSWVITWFSHVIPDERIVEQIFKFLETRDPHMVLYICAEIVIFTRDRLLHLEMEMSTVHHFLCQVPRKEKLPWDELIQRASNTFSRWEPEVVKQKLESYRKSKLQVNRSNYLSSFAHNFVPAISNIVASNGRTAVIVLILASAIALQFDRWTR